MRGNRDSLIGRADVERWGAAPWTRDQLAPKTCAGWCRCRAATTWWWASTRCAYLEVHQGHTLFNTGSLGSPRDAPDAPYVILKGDTSVEPGPMVTVTFVRVPYDVKAEIATAQELRMPDADDYALELRHQVYRGATPSPS